MENIELIFSKFKGMNVRVSFYNPSFDQESDILDLQIDYRDSNHDTHRISKHFTMESLKDTYMIEHICDEFLHKLGFMDKTNANED